MTTINIHAVLGNSQKLDGGAMFGNAPREMWKQWASPDEMNRVKLACRALLLRDGKQTILFETGIGSFFDPKLKDRFGVVENEHVLLNNLAALGVSPEKVDAVVLSHLHFDHAGGLLNAFGDGEPRLIFPQAKFYVGKEHWKRAKNPHARDRASFVPHLHELLENSGRLVLVDADGKSDLAPLVTFRFSDGHTPGLMMSQLNLPDGPLVFVADLIPGKAWMHVPITMGYDRFPELLIEEKAQLLSELVTKNGRVFFTHDPETACVWVKRDVKGKYFGAVDEL